MASRPKTLIVGICPILMGVSIVQHINIFVFLMTLLCAAFIQIGTNIANDYFDFKKGADTNQRLGPIRVTQAGLIPPYHMKIAMILTFGFSALLGLYLVYIGGIYIFIIGLISILCGVLYTAGPYPIGYLGLGDLFVLIFFGPISVAGTYFLQTHHWDFSTFILGLSPGLFSVALLSVNNIRDYEEDKKSGKKTLAVRFGLKLVRIEYVGCIYLGILIPLFFSYFYPAFIYLGSVRIFFQEIYTLMLLFLGTILCVFFLRKKGRELNSFLGKTVFLMFLTTILFFFTMNEFMLFKLCEVLEKFQILDFVLEASLLERFFIFLFCYFYLS